MPINAQKEIPATWNQVAAFRLARHHLLARAPVNQLASAAGAVGGVQAQLSLWSRVYDLQLPSVALCLSPSLPSAASYYP